MRFFILSLLLTLPLAAVEPQIVTIEKSGAMLVVPINRTEFTSQTRQVVVNVNGNLVVRNEVVTVPVLVTTYVPIDLKSADYVGRDGKPIDAKKLPDVLKKGAVIAIGEEGKPFDPKVVEKNKEIVAYLVTRAVAKKDAPVGNNEPYLATVWLVDGNLGVIRNVMAYKDEEGTETRTTPDGKVVTVKVLRKLPVTQQVEFRIDRNATEVCTADGKVIPEADWGKVLREKTKAVVSPLGKPISDDVRKQFKEANLLIYVSRKP